MDNRIRFDIADNQFTLDFAEEVKAEDLSLKVIRNDDPSLDIAWNEKDEQFHWINSGPNLLFSLLYPKRAVTGTAKFYLNPGLANFLKKVPQNVVYEIQIFNCQFGSACYIKHPGSIFHVKNMVISIDGNVFVNDDAPD